MRQLVSQFLQMVGRQPFVMNDQEMSGWYCPTSNVLRDEKEAPTVAVSRNRVTDTRSLRRIIQLSISLKHKKLWLINTSVLKSTQKQIFFQSAYISNEETWIGPLLNNYHGELWCVFCTIGQRDGIKGQLQLMHFVTHSVRQLTFGNTIAKDHNCFRILPIVLNGTD